MSNFKIGIFIIGNVRLVFAVFQQFHWLVFFFYARLNNIFQYWYSTWFIFSIGHTLSSQAWNAPSMSTEIVRMSFLGNGDFVCRTEADRRKFAQLKISHFETPRLWIMDSTISHSICIRVFALFFFHDASLGAFPEKSFCMHLVRRQQKRGVKNHQAALGEFSPGKTAFIVELVYNIYI